MSYYSLSTDMLWYIHQKYGNLATQSFTYAAGGMILPEPVPADANGITWRIVPVEE